MFSSCLNSGWLSVAWPGHAVFPFKRERMPKLLATLRLLLDHKADINAMGEPSVPSFR